MNGNSVNQLISNLRRIEDKAPGAANRNPRLGLRNAIKFLESHRSESVDSLVERLSATQKTAPKKKPAVVVRADVVNEYLTELRTAKTDTAAFQYILEKMKSDKKIRMIELRAVVSGFVGEAIPIKTKAAGFNLIQQAFDQRWKLAHR